jgi:hypothetical protein
LDPCKLIWTKEDVGYMPVLSETQAAPEAVVELLKCSCGTSRCAGGRCTCRQNQLSCPEMCKCEASDECYNTDEHNMDIEN